MFFYSITKRFESLTDINKLSFEAPLWYAVELVSAGFTHINKYSNIKKTVRYPNPKKEQYVLIVNPWVKEDTGTAIWHVDMPELIKITLRNLLLIGLELEIKSIIFDKENYIAFSPIKITLDPNSISSFYIKITPLKEIEYLNIQGIKIGYLCFNYIYYINGNGFGFIGRKVIINSKIKVEA